MGSTAVIVAPDGREVKTLPREVLKLIYVLDDALADLGLHWNIRCPACEFASAKEPYARVYRDGDELEMRCPHAIYRVRPEER